MLWVSIPERCDICLLRPGSCCSRRAATVGGSGNHFSTNIPPDLKYSHIITISGLAYVACTKLNNTAPPIFTNVLNASCPMSLVIHPAWECLLGARPSKYRPRPAPCPSSQRAGGARPAYFFSPGQMGPISMKFQCFNLFFNLLSFNKGFF